METKPLPKILTDSLKKMQEALNDERTNIKVREVIIQQVLIVDGELVVKDIQPVMLDADSLIVLSYKTNVNIVSVIPMSEHKIEVNDGGYKYLNSIVLGEPAQKIGFDKIRNFIKNNFKA